MIEGALPVIDGRELPQKIRDLLRPGETLDGAAHATPLPRFFYEVKSWGAAHATKLTVHFTLAELMSVDCREDPELLHGFPHYLPCAVSVLARYLEEFRARVEAPVFIAVNGGYRSPAHRFSQRPSPHLWAAAANIYRIGDTFLDSEKSIERYARIAESIGQEVYVKPFGHRPGETDDHLHLDLGALVLEPAQR
jgi:hypothetical protein